MRIAIIGAGVGGMAAAYDLHRAGHEVILFEAAKSPGGLAAGFKDPSWVWSVEQYYHHCFEGDVRLFALLDQLGLKNRLEWHNGTTG